MRRIETLDAMDAANLAECEAARAKFTQPAEGDYVTFADGVTLRIASVWGDRFQPTKGGSWHFSKSGHMSFSGGLSSSVELATLTDTGETRQATAWFFRHGFRTAHNGVTVETPVRVWACSEPSTPDRRR